jgi:hypothetical protein
MRRRLPAIPFPHFMAFAPLDAWARLLLHAGFIRPVYWLRLAFALFTSAIGTALTLPERLLLAPFLLLGYRRSAGVIQHEPGAVVVLGYYRTGTTHLHYMLACDPHFRWPMWCETLMPQGFALSWTFMRLFLVPFMGGKRPQDEVSLGPEWPAEDDFATGTWAMASALPGRMMLPSDRGWARYSRFHDLSRLSPRELGLWRYVHWAFLTKLGWLAPRRPLLIKTPSHTARVAELLRMFPAGKLKFVHISRDAEPVIRSNVAMLERFRTFHLEDEPGVTPDDAAAAHRSRVEAEYAATELKYLKERSLIPAGCLSEIRFEDLHADPLGAARKIYSDLRLDWTEPFEHNLLTYLDTVRTYRPANRGQGETTTALPPVFADLKRAFAHNQPKIPKVDPPPPPASAMALDARARRRRIAIASVTVPLACFVIWAGLAYLRDSHFNGFVWAVGVAIGWSLLKAARVGSPRLGLLAVALTALVMIPVTFLNTRTVSYIPNPHPGVPIKFFPEIWETSIKNLLQENTLLWRFVGLMSAYRFASRRHVSPFGRN